MLVCCAVLCCAVAVALAVTVTVALAVAGEHKLASFTIQEDEDPHDRCLAAVKAALNGPCKRSGEAATIAHYKFDKGECYCQWGEDMSWQDNSDGDSCLLSSIYTEEQVCARARLCVCACVCVCARARVRACVLV